jgi:hypothetical protein
VRRGLNTRSSASNQQHATHSLKSSHFPIEAACAHLYAHGTFLFLHGVQCVVLVVVVEFYPHRSLARSLGGYAKTRYSGGKPPCPMCHRSGWVGDEREAATGLEYAVCTHIDDQHALYAFLSPYKQH